MSFRVYSGSYRTVWTAVSNDKNIKHLRHDALRYLIIEPADRYVLLKRVQNYLIKRYEAQKNAYRAKKTFDGHICHHVLS